MKITEHRTKEILNWLDDKAADHTLLFEEMTLHRDSAALIRQLQAELQDAWHAGLDAGREQGRGKDHAHPSPSVPLGVEGLVAKWRDESESLNIHPAGGVARRVCARDLERALEAAQPGGSDNDR